MLSALVASLLSIPVAGQYQFQPQYQYQPQYSPQYQPQTQAPYRFPYNQGTRYPTRYPNYRPPTAPPSYVPPYVPTYAPTRPPYTPTPEPDQGNYYTPPSVDYYTPPSDTAYGGYQAYQASPYDSFATADYSEAPTIKHRGAYGDHGYLPMNTYIGDWFGTYTFGGADFCDDSGSYGNTYDREACYGGLHAQRGFWDSGRYVHIDHGYCEEWGCDRVYNEHECQFAATTLGLPDRTVSEARSLSNPAGCYYRPQYQTLWFNYESSAPSQYARQNICFCPNDYAPTYQPNPFGYGA